jgi:hypothetical protein
LLHFQIMTLRRNGNLLRLFLTLRPGAGLAIGSRGVGTRIIKKQKRLPQAMETPETYRQRAEAADRAAEAAADEEARRICKLVAQRWRQMAELAEIEEKRQSS